MPRAIWNEAVVAEADKSRVKMVEGNVYFPPDAVDRQYFRESDTHTRCHWKGLASYYDVVVGESVNQDAAWYYPEPLPAAEEITDYVAFWHGVEVEQ
ncbi:MAG: DUF427 domain-containing protein [Chloroflexia bacterium]